MGKESDSIHEHIRKTIEVADIEYQLRVAKKEYDKWPDANNFDIVNELSKKLDNLRDENKQRGTE